MRYVVSFLVALLLPPCLISIRTAENEKDKKIATIVFSVAMFFLQINWGRELNSLNLLAILITLVIILSFMLMPSKLKDVAVIFAGMVNNYLNELSDPVLTTKETVKILCYKDAVVLVIMGLGLIRPFQASLLILGTVFYLIVVEGILQDNTELKSSYKSFVKYIKLGGVTGDSIHGEEEYQETGEVPEDELLMEERKNYEESRTGKESNRRTEPKIQFKQGEKEKGGKATTTGHGRDSGPSTIERNSDEIYGKREEEMTTDFKGKRRMGTGE